MPEAVQFFFFGLWIQIIGEQSHAVLSEVEWSTNKYEMSQSYLKTADGVRSSSIFLFSPPEMPIVSDRVRFDLMRICL